MRGSTRSYYFIKELAKRHAITLVSLTKQQITPHAMREMSAYTEKIITFNANGALIGRITRVLSHVPLMGGRLKKIFQFREAIGQMKMAVTTLVQREPFDVVLFHGNAIARVIEDINIPVVVDFCDAMSMQYLSRMRYAEISILPLLGLRYLQVKRRENKAVRRSPYIAFVSRRDMEATLGRNGHGKVVSIGVDHAFWKRGSKSSSSNSIVFVGVLDYPPNADAALFLADKILPLVKRSIPDVKVFIVGRNPSVALRQRAKGHPGVTITGYVDDVRPYLEKATVSAVPVRFGCGVQNKVLEAMAMEVPVITTSLVAAGLRVTDDEEVPVVVADRENEFCDRIVQLLRDTEERDRLATKGRYFIERYFNWSPWAEELERMCVSAASAKGELD